MKFNLFLICYSRYEKETDWLSYGLKLALSPVPGPPKDGGRGSREERPPLPLLLSPPSPRRTSNLKPTYRKPLGKLPITRQTTFASIPCPRDR